MTIRARSRIRFGAALVLTAAMGLPAAGAGPREKIPMTIAERDKLLAGMRVYLESIEGITVGLSNNRMADAASSARRSGKALLEDVDPASALSVPMTFTILSLDTHEKFDAIAAKAKAKAPKSEILQDLGAILSNCTGCHANYRIVPARQ